jgi:hypothetical protein
MGQAFDRDGNVLGEAYGDTQREVFEKLTAEFKNAHEIRIRTLEATAAEQRSDAQMEMPRYKCHKEVHALKIADIRLDDILIVEAPYSAVRVSREWMEKHEPKVGGYYVVYEDGYASFSPAQAFENGYARI